MAFHVNPETGEASNCRAKNGRCPFGGAEDHFDSFEEAREYYESTQETFASKRTLKLSSAADSALALPLTPQPAPSWLAAQAKLQEETFGTTPEYLGTVQTPAGELGVVWEQNSTAANDESSQLKRGYQLSRLTLNDPKTGEELGYIKLVSQNSESIARSFGNDEWQEFAWATDAESFRGFRVYKRNVDGKTERSIPLRQGGSQEEILEGKKELWAGGFASLKTTPPNFDRSQLSWADLINLTKDHAPTDETRLDEELNVIRKELRKRLDAQLEWHGDPTIDYIRMSNKLRGQGTGQALYILGARMLGKRGQKLRASGIQTEFAQAAWERLGADPRIPMRTERKVVSPHRPDEFAEYKFLDFSSKENS